MLLKGEAIRVPLAVAAHQPREFSRRNRPAVALVGRSNVGKSSLLNRLLGKSSARVSKTPGRTRGIYLYETAQGHDLADLPGTGFARASGTERAGWADLVARFFETGQVALVVHLIDARVPGTAGDLVLRDYLAGLGLPVLPVATKWDGLSRGEKVRARRRLDAVHGSVLPVSARTGEGIESLRREICRRLESLEEVAPGSPGLSRGNPAVARVSLKESKEGAHG